MDRNLLKKWGAPLALALLVFVAAEGAARWIMARQTEFTSFLRNPCRYRGWPAYVSRAEPDPAIRDVVLLTNCQGYGGEYDARMGYAAELQKNLNAAAPTGTSWRVLNWSVDGATSLEYVMLAAHLRRHPRAVVLALAASADFRAEHFSESFSYCRSDIPRLLADPRTAALAPAGWLRRHSSLEDSLQILVETASAYVRLPELFWSWSERFCPGSLNVFYAPAMNYVPWMLRRQGGTGFRLPPKPAFEPAITYDARSRQMVEEYVQTLAAIPARVIVAAEPLHPDYFASAQQAFLADLRAATTSQGVEFWDLHDVFPPEIFRTSNHFKRSGHVALGKLIADKLQPAMGEE